MAENDNNGGGNRAPENAYIRYNARLLDPTTAGKLPGGGTPQMTAYVSDHLLVTASSRSEADQILLDIDEVIEETPYRRRRPLSPFDPVDEGTDDLSRDQIRQHNRRAEILALALEVGVPVTFRVAFTQTGGDSRTPEPVDVWNPFRRILAQDKEFRVTDGASSAGAQPRLTGTVGLDHLMFASAYIMGNPAHPIANALVNGEGAHPIANSYADPSYTQPGSGGRAPVAVTLAVPQGNDSGPHVVVLDTGVGAHRWFQAPYAGVCRDLTFAGGHHVGYDVSAPKMIDTDPESLGAIPDRMTGMLASHAGHGTFITGLLRQTAPDAEISTLRIMGADGVVPEGELGDALMHLSIRQVKGGGADEPGRADALVLSLGYYPEIDDADFTAGLRIQLFALAIDGVRIFAAAGNDCTERRSYPAAFAVAPEFAAAGTPLRSVAALNPDPSTVALFSNDGDWVTDYEAGANVISTMPRFPDGSYQSIISTTGPTGRVRATIDPDDYRGGFAVWSGTSFATPIAAGRHLATMGNGMSAAADSGSESDASDTDIGEDASEVSPPQ